jgi:FecR protein
MARFEMKRGYRWTLMALVIAAALAFGRTALAIEVGQTTLAVKLVVAHEAQKMRQLFAPDPVHDSERIQTGADSAAAFALIDGTELALGPDAEVTLDEFIYDPNVGAGRMMLNVAVGAMRFATGAMPKPAYTIRTPSAVISVRGTIFTSLVTAARVTFIAVHEGAIRALSNTGEEFDVPAGSYIRLDDTSGIVRPGLIAPGGIDFDVFFDGSLANDRVRVMDDILREEAGRNPERATRATRVVNEDVMYEDAILVSPPKKKSKDNRGDSGRDSGRGGQSEGHDHSD